MGITAKASLDIVLNLTRLRDRDALEVGLAAALYGLARPERLRAWRIVEQQGEKYLSQCLLFDEESLLHVPEIQLDLDQMQPLQHWPAVWREVCESGQPQVSLGQDVSLLLPVCLPQPILLIQLENVDAETQQDLPELHWLMQVYANHLRMLDYAEKDTLTGLLNRKTFETHFNKLLALESISDEKNRRFHQRRRHSDAGLWLAEIDIDYFKSINDRFGHLYGDEVLLLLSGVLKRHLRLQDNLYRFGGEEFVAVLCPTSDEDAQQVFERLRHAVEEHEFPQVGKVTISIGYTRILANADASTVLGEADEALYYAKHHGRNQCCNYATLVQQHLTPEKTTHSDAELF